MSNPEPEVQPTQWFHVTFASRVRKIQSQGITLGHKRNWNNKFGGKLGDTKRIYIIDDFTAAVRWAFEMEYNFERPAVILMLSGPPDTLEWDTNGGSHAGGQHWYTTRQTFPPEAISRVIPLTKDLSRSVAQTGWVALPE